jgi:hypothetical protein
MYYPKSQITTNLYTNGGELVYLNNNLNYKGFYFKTSKGKYFTGKVPNDGPNSELIEPKIISIEPLNSPNTVKTFEPQPSEFIPLDYPKYKYTGFLLPNSSQPQLTDDDYALGEVTRYFCKKTNEVIYIEINKDVHTKLTNKNPDYLWQMYIPFKYQWTISGDKEQVYKTNKNITKYMMDNFKFIMFDKFLREDYLKFYK